mgnify:CR=1 FL=1
MNQEPIKLETRQLCVGYRRKAVVSGVEFCVRAGEILALVGPNGAGKSTLMKRVAAAAEERGLQVEYIRCSGDPDSLDAILLPEKKTAIVDGTAPHERAAIGPFTGTSI